MKLSSILAQCIVGVMTAAVPVLAQDRWTLIPHWDPMPEPVSSGLAEVNGISMYYATFGTGDLVLLIHGGMNSSDSWGAQVADLMTDHLVIVADSRGHGRSSRNERPFSYDLMADDYIALLDFLDIQKVDLVGWSDGAIIGLDIAMRYPERLDDLFAQGVNVTPDGISFDVPPSAAAEAMFGWMAEDYARMSPTPDEFEAFSAQMFDMYGREPNWSDEQLATITTPTTIAFAEYDELISRSHNQHIVEVIPGAKLVILPGVSHVAPLQAPDEYSAAVRDAIDD